LSWKIGRIAAILAPGRKMESPRNKKGAKPAKSAPGEGRGTGKDMNVNALIVAAGRGERLAAETRDKIPKQYRAIGGTIMLRHTLAQMLSHPAISRATVVINPGDRELYEAAVEGLEGDYSWVAGGATRQNSVRAGLRAMRTACPEHVLIHDAARPFVSHGLIDRVLEGLKKARGVIPAIPVSDTLKKAVLGEVTATMDRTGIVAAQTPQGFYYSALADAHIRAAKEGISDFTDDSALAEWAGIPVHTTQGDSANRKITTAEDFAEADWRARMEKLAARGDVRTGQGFDVHTFGPGDHVTLCGVRIDAAMALVGHSDADVGLHALTDAVLGAIGAGDIGSHFPPSDPQWKGASSDRFLAHAANRLRALDGEIANVDVTLICEEPKIGPHREAMREAIARILGIAVEKVSVKATTTEGLGFTGRREGIAAPATATVRMPFRG
jgi:2-C-methyl-D-erythritol 4-phosphate cytidylyltransferase/2-C-methyl-D-erythritol 2,4-cyclodiphosphate synthase